MLNIKSKIKSNWKIILTLFLMIFLTGLIVSFYLYQKNKITKENTLKVETKLIEKGFDTLYQKQDNIFCVNEKNKKRQEDISRDMLWTLELEGKNSETIEKVNCGDGSNGIKVN